MTMPNSDLLHPLHQPAMKIFVAPVTFQSLLTITCSECHSVIRKSSPRETCATSGESRHLACTYLQRRERESICYGCREWRCSAQPNLHQRALCQAETIPHPVKYPRAQCCNKCQLYTRSHKKMELPPTNHTEKICCNQSTAGKGSMLSLHNPDPTGGLEISMLVMQSPITP